MRRFALILLICATPAAAENWVVVPGDKIGATLTGQKLNYDGAWQVFHASGRTLYNAGRDSWGYWQVRSDRYCSQWPPADGWACYGVEINGTDLVRFIGESGAASVGQLTPQE